MLRIQKRYILNYGQTEGADKVAIPGRIATFSSYPGIVASHVSTYWTVGDVNEKQSELLYEWFKSTRGCTRCCLCFKLNAEWSAPSLYYIVAHFLAHSIMSTTIPSLQDDFAVLSSGLVTQETTIGNNNNDLWQYCLPEGQVSSSKFEALEVRHIRRLGSNNNCKYSELSKIMWNLSFHNR